MKKILLSVLILCLAFAGTLPVRAEALLSVGDIVLFGRYEQDNDPADGPEEIEWIVLDIRDGSVKLLSRCLLDIRHFNEENAFTTWENSPLRAWLNSGFMETVFSGEERALLHTVAVPAPSTRQLSYGVKPGKDTEDKVHLLSLDECEAYFFGSEDLLLGPITAYVGSLKFPRDEKTGSGDWWLRTPGKSNKGFSFVFRGGKVERDGMIVTANGGIRPVIELSESDIDPSQVRPSEYTALLTGASVAAAAKEQFEIDRDTVRNLCRQNYYRELETLSGEPVISGKLVFSVRTENASEIDSFTELWYGGSFYDVPDRLLAKNLAEADTAIFIYCENLQVGSYSDSGRSVPAYRTTTYVAVMDLHQNAVYKAWEVAADDPPETATIWDSTLAVSGKMDLEGAIRQVLEKYTE